MKEWSRWVGAVSVCCIVGCGQDLALPDGYGPAGSDAEPGPVDGITGAGGAADTSAPGKLPVTDQPIYTSFGGAANDDGPAGAGRSGSSSGSRGGAGTSPRPAEGDAGAGGEPASVEPLARLLFSEYVEGSGSFKALELFALEGGSLEGCSLETYSNGKMSPTRLALHGALESGAVQVLCSSALATAQPATCSRSTSLTFNGDDALALVCAGVVADVIGELGVDPGDSWGAGATLDHTLQRRCSVTVGRSDGATPFVIDAEWLAFDVDTFSDLGQRSCD